MKGFFHRRKVKRLKVRLAGLKAKLAEIDWMLKNIEGKAPLWYVMDRVSIKQEMAEIEEELN